MNDLLVRASDPTFLAFTATIAGVLASASATLFALRFLLKRDVTGLWKTLRGWLIMVPTVLLVLALGRVATIVGVALLSFFGFREYARATGLYRDWWYVVAVYLGIFGVTALSLMTDPNTGELGWYGMFIASPVYMVVALVSIPVLRNRTQGQLQQVSLSILGFVYLGFMFTHLGYLANAKEGLGYLLFLFVAVPLTDVGAFTFGKLFGRHKLRSQVSPNKTLAGGVGALLLAMALPWLLRFSFPHFGTAELLLTGLIVGLGGQFGDLTISFIKRDIGIKDMGQSIPGHGGILDRIDSLIIVAPLFFHMVRWFHGV